MMFTRQLTFAVLTFLALSITDTGLADSPVLPDPDGKPADMTKKVKVFIIMGQSNTLEMGKVKGDKEGSLEHATKTENLYLRPTATTAATQRPT